MAGSTSESVRRAKAELQALHDDALWDAQKEYEAMEPSLYFETDRGHIRRLIEYCKRELRRRNGSGINNSSRWLDRNNERRWREENGLPDNTRFGPVTIE